MDFAAFSRDPIFFIVSVRCGLDKDSKNFDRCFIDLEDPIFFPSNAPKIDDTAFEENCYASYNIDDIKEEETEINLIISKK